MDVANACENTPMHQLLTFRLAATYIIYSPQIVETPNTTKLLKNPAAATTLSEKIRGTSTVGVDNVLTNHNHHQEYHQASLMVVAQ